MQLLFLAYLTALLLALAGSLLIEPRLTLLEASPGSVNCTAVDSYFEARLRSLPHSHAGDD